MIRENNDFTNSFVKIVRNKEKSIAIVGLGYVGLPLAALFGNQVKPGKPVVGTVLTENGLTDDAPALTKMLEQDMLSFYGSKFKGFHDNDWIELITNEETRFEKVLFSTFSPLFEVADEEAVRFGFSESLICVIFLLSFC